jgi:hypothetical protein
MNKGIIGGASEPVVIYSVNGQALNYDDRSNSLVVSTLFDQAVNEEKMWDATYATPSTIADNASLDMLIIVPANIKVDMVMSSTGGGDSEIFFYENAVVSNNGTPLPIVNLNRNSVGTPALQLFITPTITNAGNQLSNFFVPGGTGPHSSGNIAAAGRKWIFKANTIYLLRTYNRAGAAKRMGCGANWTESQA